MVHTYCNIYVTTSGEPLFGHKILNKNRTTKKSHLLTFDKPVLSVPMIEAFRDGEKEATLYGRKEGLILSDFDDFMPKGNPFVNFKTSYE